MQVFYLFRISFLTVWLLKEIICNDPYWIYFPYLLIIKQMKEMWQVSWKVTFASKYPSFAKDQQEKKSGPVATYV